MDKTLIVEPGDFLRVSLGFNGWMGISPTEKELKKYKANLANATVESVNLETGEVVIRFLDDLIIPEELKK